MNNNDLLLRICKHGNVYMLQQYLAWTMHRPLSCSNLVYLIKAIDAGNEQFVRLMLKEHNKRTWTYVTACDFKRPGISVGMLKLLHEEYDILFNVEVGLWSKALIYSTKCNIMESVQYILANISTAWRESHADEVEQTIINCMVQCVNDDNIPMLQCLIDMEPTTFQQHCEYINHRAIQFGHESIVRHLLTLQPNNNKILLELPSGPCRKRFAETRLRNAILMDDVDEADSIITLMTFELGPDLCQSMSVAMAKRLFSPRQRIRLIMSGGTLSNMLNAIGKRGSSITVDIINMIIDNCNLISPSGIQNLLLWTSGKSASLMQKIHNRFNIPYNLDCLAMALNHGCLETLAILFEHMEVPVTDIEPPLGIKSGLEVFIKAASLDNVIMVLDKLPSIKVDQTMCHHSLFNPSIDVFVYIFNKLELSTTLLTELVKMSYNLDNLQVLRYLHQHVPASMMATCLEPSQNTLTTAGYDNCHHVLKYYFEESTTFNNMSIPLRLRQLHSLLGFVQHLGATRLISLCTELINKLIELDTRLYHQ
ncbi:hypothetical protein SAMD00019534_096090 [Acytostelium subglobosum LB1]|uniref:hypothetical protein n=1 Tax=Acytostelium subglobosum LB1 TaxID=1410327 RepID=UPI00064495C0|nr:hypothetical protein SAMD00019534_096090 [Acytostelium subglobosum LB1]GAM26434.1 hypothetical protein SAMD00019534_096090 [Acytostelium subglobosum LB1]|eukprot:XP_012750530.1 hypothetical protein SAMD00019534_096090 [Acytostelium subglobosum LB1]